MYICKKLNIMKKKIDKENAVVIIGIGVDTGDRISTNGSDTLVFKKGDKTIDIKTNSGEFSIVMMADLKDFTDIEDSVLIKGDGEIVYDSSTNTIEISEQLEAYLFKTQNDLKDFIEKEIHSSLSFDQLMNWYDSKKEEIEQSTEEEKEKEDKLKTLETQRLLAIDSHYIHNNIADESIAFEEQIDWYDKEIEDAERKIKALKRNKETAIYLKDQNDKLLKFKSTEFDFYQIKESIDKEFDNILKEKVDDYYQCEGSIEYIDVDKLQEVVNTCEDRLESVLKEIVEDTNKITLTFKVKKDYIDIKLGWVIDGEMENGLVHTKHWYYATDHIKNWRRMKNLFGKSDKFKDWVG